MDFISWTCESFIPYSYEINLAATGSALTVVPHYQYKPDYDPKALRVSVHIRIVHHVFDWRNSNCGIVLNVLKLEAIHVLLKELITYSGRYCVATLLSQGSIYRWRWLLSACASNSRWQGYMYCVSYVYVFCAGWKYSETVSSQTKLLCCSRRLFCWKVCWSARWDHC